MKKQNLLSSNKELIKYLKNKEDANLYTSFSNKRIMCKCPNCGYEKDMIVSCLTKKVLNVIYVVIVHHILKNLRLIY